MSKQSILTHAVRGAAIAAMLITSLGPVAAVPAMAQPVPVSPDDSVTLSVGAGRMVRLSAPISDLFVANDAIADVQVRSPSQIYIFGKGAGETTLYATNAAGKVVYSATVRVGANIGSVDEMLQLAMPEAQIRATPMNGVVLLTGTVASPTDVEEAGRLVQAFVGDGVQVVSRLKTATPLQVMLQVKIAEVNRSLVKDIGVNLLTRDATSGFQFGIGQGRGFTPQWLPGVGAPLTVADDGPGTLVVPSGRGTTLFGAGRLLGLDILSALDLAENEGRSTTLAEPNLTALSGETASFLAGGEFPIATSNGINGTSIEFKEYGVSLAFTPTVLEGGRISMRVRPEVSELTSEGAISLNGFQIPALTTRRTETTVELGSGQSMMLAGLLRNTSSNGTDKAPFLGDLPIIGALFRSNSFRRNETELVIVVTPYLVKPVNPNQIALPTDGFRTANDGRRLLLGGTMDSRAGEQRPGPVAAPAQTYAPGVGPLGAVGGEPPLAPTQPQPGQQAAIRPQAPASPQPGFSF